MFLQSPSFLKSLGRRPLLLGLLAGAAALVGCSSTRLLDAVTPAGRYTREADIAYGPDTRQRLDLYRPQDQPPSAVIVFFYGGSWRSGSKDGYRFVAESLTRHGFAVAIPDYRLYPQVRFPGFVEDGAAAVRVARERLGPGTRLYVMGHSAGAHIAALLALDPRYLGGAGLAPGDLAGLISLSGPLDFLPLTSRRTAEVFAGTGDLNETQPITYAGRGAPPALLLHGADDTTVYVRNSERLAAKLRQAGAEARLIVYPRRGHVDIMLGLSSALAGDSSVMEDILAFVRS